MKKVIAVLILLFVAFSANAYAEEGDIWSERLDIYFEIEKDGLVKPDAVRVLLLDDSGKLLASEKVTIDENTKSADFHFLVPEYIVGKSFYIVPFSGMEKVTFSGAKYKHHAPVKVTTRVSVDEGGNERAEDSFFFSLTPVYETPEERAMRCYGESVEKTINDSGLDSKTDFFIWVSKKDFTVNVLTGSKGNWEYLTSFPCSIGAPETPTITGVFEYFQYQEKWNYAKYYCAPIMRFAPKGYAMHSTLIKYDGTPYDDRLGLEISHGCVRIAPENIRWLADNMPLYTRVYITN